MDKEILAKALGAFLFMVSEAILGKTRFGSWLGLAKAGTWFILGATVVRVFRAIKRIGKKENDDAGSK